MISKNEFRRLLCKNGDAEEFLKYFQRCLTDFYHTYEIAAQNGAWVEFNQNSRDWVCTSLIDACAKYYWGNLNRTDTNQRILKLKDRIQNTGNDANSYARSCIDIMSWGGVERQNGLTILQLHLDGRLIEMVNNSLAIMESEEPDLSKFENKDCIMTSGFSKIYALQSNDNISIYDSRVACGLGLILRGHYSEYNNIPDELRFPRPKGLTKRRIVKFQCGNKQPGFQSNYAKYAEWNIKYNWLIQYLIDEPNTDINIGSTHDDSSEFTLHEKMVVVEQALFMIGYAV